ncbi:hypothetical protein ABDJ41_21010 [Pedobacter sp. ASV1-7]|uniref:hypothetical protein n=1 Tax=Pedobacter sp. ASV1-7 TaxID=3145237 RepID=UPI0032E8E206
MNLSKIKDFISGIFLLAILVLAVAFIIYMCYRIWTSPNNIFPLSMLALMGGLLFESIRVAKKWSYILWTFIGSFIFSLFIFIPGKNERYYNFESHLVLWPYIFLALFTFISSIVYRDKTTARLNEQITLLQSMAIIYLVIDYNLLQLDNWLAYTSLSIGLLFCLFSFFNALTPLILSKSNRLWLSVWSSIIMLILSIDNIYRIFSQGEIENTWNVSDSLIIGLQYFLLGISGMYIGRNIIMLLGFFPSKGSFFNTKYFRDLDEIKYAHINRYDEKQSYISHSIICILLTFACYYINYRYQYLPAHSAIWISFVLFPLFFTLSRLRR